MENSKNRISPLESRRCNVYYVTDVICSHCWTQEPVLRSFIEHYGDYFTFHTVMGGLLEKWHDGPIDPGNGIYKPADVAGHWREVGKHSRMPIDGSLMIDNPIQSSYPPSRVFKIIQKNHNEDKALEFLRRAREALFVFNQNIGENSVLIDLVNRMDLDGQGIVGEADLLIGRQLLNEDIDLARRTGARSFPTIIMINEDNKVVRIVGGRPLEDYVNGLKEILNLKELQKKEPPSISNLLEREKLLFSKEIEIMYHIEQSEVITFVEKELLQDTYKMEEFLGEFYFTAR